MTRLMLVPAFLLLSAVLLPAAAHAEPVELTNLAAGLDVKQRELVGRATWFHTDESHIWIHATLANPGAAQTIEMVWRREGEERWRVSLEVGSSPRWRTWSRKRIREQDAGKWTVEVLDARGRSLGSTTFTVEDEPGC